MNERTRVVLWGSSGQATVVSEAMDLTGLFELVGCIDDVDPAPRTTAAGRVLGSSDRLGELRSSGVAHIIVAVGDNAARLDLAARAEALGFAAATVIHPRASVSELAQVGPGTVICAGAVIAPTARLGAHCIVNHGASVDHDTTIDDGVHVGPGSHVAGHVHVGRGTLLGVGTSVRDGVRIGAHTVVGAGAAVVGDLPDSCVAVGVPAHVVSRSSGSRSSVE